MSRLIPHHDMTEDQIAKCCIQARALINLCARATWADIQNGNDGKEISIAAEDIQFALELVYDILEPVQDALEDHEDRNGGVK